MILFSDSYEWEVFVVSSSLICFLILWITLYIRNRHDRRLLRELKATGMDKFEDGDPDRIDPATAIKEQANLLPYDKTFEFRRDKIEICDGRRLGAGAFGVVYEAIAKGILPNEEETIVAVKMVNKMANFEVLHMSRIADEGKD